MSDHWCSPHKIGRYDPVMGDNDRGSHASVPGDSSVDIPTTSSGGAVTRNLQSRKYRATQLRGPTSRDVQLSRLSLLHSFCLSIVVRTCWEFLVVINFWMPVVWIFLFCQILNGSPHCQFNFKEHSDFLPFAYANKFVRPLPLNIILWGRTLRVHGYIFLLVI